MTLNNIKTIIDLKPQGIMIGSAITGAENPLTAALAFKDLL